MLHRDVVRITEMVDRAWKTDRRSLTGGRRCGQHSTGLGLRDSHPVTGGVPK